MKRMQVCLHCKEAIVFAFGQWGLARATNFTEVFKCPMRQYSAHEPDEDRAAAVEPYIVRRSELANPVPYVVPMLED